MLTVGQDRIRVSGGGGGACLRAKHNEEIQDARRTRKPNDEM